ncbi:GLPGLI family protein [Flavobacterium sp. TP390]|uniref:GLPGLI family protein n=1 Tax=Flavobacterium profundi TaxID=1774945 RepID=A0A6I4IKK2_9FLAO|nr:GLPGLI family protein [Flavobacterium profundi]MVO08889.1 GLPGLI family protein [Flavobacterium profundi]
MSKQNQLVLFLFFSLTISAQQKQGIVNYGYIKSIFHGQKQGEEYNAQLTFDSMHSYFVSEKDSLETITDKTITQPVFTESNEGNETLGTIKLNSSELFTNYVGNQVYFDREKDTLWSYVMGMGNIYIKEKKPAFNWKFEKETKKIGKYTCHKATAPFRGRDYTVWYTTEIPIPYGPWKLNGLPGLVLEGYDSEYKIYFYFKNIQYPLKNEIKIDFIKENIEEKFTRWFSYKEYLAHVNYLIESEYESMLLIAKDHPKFIPTKQKIDRQYIEITE